MESPRIVVNPNGSLRIEGGIPLVRPDGTVIETPADRPYSLCRCGASARKPFCDGSHRAAGFKDPEEASGA